MADHRLATGDQLTRSYFLRSDERGARRLLNRLTEWRVLDRLPRRVGGVRSGSQGFIYCLGPAGYRLLKARGLTLRRLGRPGARYIDRTLAISELVVRLREAHGLGRLELVGVDPEPMCWRSFIGASGARVVIKPDLFVRIGAGALEDRWMIEIDRATEHPATLVAKAKRYVSHVRSGSEQREFGIYPRVLWTVPTERRRYQLTEILRPVAGGLSSLFAVSRFDEAVDLLVAEAEG